MAIFSKLLKLYPDGRCYKGDTLCYFASVGDAASIRSILGPLPPGERLRLLHEFDKASRNAALHHAAANAQSDCVALLLKFGADPDLRNEDGNTALMYAVWENDLHSMALLLDAGADINIGYEDGDPSFFFATTMEAASYLLYRGANIRAMNKLEQTVLLHWLSRDEMTQELLLLLLSHGCPVDSRGFVKRQDIPRQRISAIEYCLLTEDYEYLSAMSPYSDDYILLQRIIALGELLSNMFTPSP